MKRGSETAKGLRPSPTAGIGSTRQETSTHVPRGQTSNVRIRTIPLTTSTLGFTKHATVEPSTSIYQASSIAHHWNNGLNSFKELISTPESKGSVNSLYYSTKLTSTSAPIIPSSSSIYQPTSRESPARHRQGLSNELLAGVVAGGLTLLILIGLLLLAVIFKRRKTDGLVVAQSNTETSFDNLGFNGGRKISEYMDLTELELVRVKVSNTVKRKISTFTKDDQKTCRVSCGRLELVEVPANTNIDDDILLTAWV